MKEIVFKKIKLSKKNLVDNDPFCKNSYLISIQKYVSITLKDMEFSEVSNKRKTETRYGSRALIYNKKTEKKEGKFFYKLVSYYKGNLKNGKADGWGIEVLKYQPDRIVNPTFYPNHEVVQYYEGEWKNNMKHGYGILTFNALDGGEIIEGEFPIIINRSQDGLLDWQDWARIVLWYGHRRGNYLYNIDKEVKYPPSFPQHVLMEAAQTKMC